MIRRLVLLVVVSSALAGCKEPTPTATVVPPTATTEPTAVPTTVPTPAGMTVGEYRQKALEEVGLWSAANEKFTADSISGAWKTDPVARTALIDEMKDALLIVQRVQHMDPPDEARDAHERLKAAMVAYARAIKLYADVIDMTVSGDLTGAAAKSKEYVTAMNTMSETIGDDIAAVKTLPETP